MKMEKALLDYLGYLNIPISKNYVKKSMFAHPEYPSLLSIADTLERLGIDHQIGQVENKNIDVISFPCLLHFKNQGGQFLFVKDPKDLEEQNINIKNWGGIVLKVGSTESIVDEEHNEQFDRENIRKKLLLTTGVSLLALFTVLAVQASPSLLSILLFGTSLAGSVLGFLLIAKDLGITYKPVETFCNAGKRTNCDQILNTEDATIFGTFTFSDAAGSYFFYQLLTVAVFLPLMDTDSSFLWGLAGASLLTIPIIAYSIYYQSMVANTWCRLCIIVDVILGLQLGIFSIMYLESIFTLTSVSVFPLLLSALLFIIIASSVLLFKNRLQVTDKADSAISAKRIKHDPGIFTELLRGEENVDTTPFSPEITLGYLEAPLHITVVANLHCNPCKIAFNTITQLLSVYPQKLYFRIRFTAGGQKTMGELSPSAYLIRYWKQHICGAENENKRTRQLLSDWYGRMDPETFLQDYVLDDAQNGDDKKPEAQHYEWVAKHEIKRTPTFFINGYKMPQNYKINDLMAMTPGLAAVWKTKRKSSKEFA